MHLSDKKRYPLLFRTCNPESLGNPARVAFLKHYNWKNVAALYQDEGLFTLVSGRFEQSPSTKVLCVRLL